MKYTTYEQEYIGGTRTIYTATIGNTTYHTDTLEKLTEFINSHIEEAQGTF